MAALILPLISNKDGAVHDSTVCLVSRLLQSDVAKAGGPQQVSEILVRVVKLEHLPSHLFRGALAVDLVQSYSRHQIADAEACTAVGTFADSKLGEPSYIRLILGFVGVIDGQTVRSGGMNIPLVPMPIPASERAIETLQL